MFRSGKVLTCSAYFHHDAVMLFTFYCSVKPPGFTACLRADFGCFVRAVWLLPENSQRSLLHAASGTAYISHGINKQCVQGHGWSGRAFQV
jgi:hypothetical protein